MGLKSSELKREIFYFVSAALAAGIILELLWPNIILAYFNLNILFALWLVSALVAVWKR